MSGQLDQTLILGRGGKGKTTLALAWTRARPRVLIFDPNGEAAHAAGAVVVDDPARLVQLVRDMGRFRICWRGFATMGGEAFEWGNRVALAAEHLTLFWDEVDRFTGSHPPPAAELVINAGRHRNLAVIACSRRPARVPRDLTANASRIVAFGSQEPSDLDYLRTFMGSEASAAVPGLAAFHAVDWTEAAWSVKKSPFP